ncbi:MAG: hypothetical protein SFV19_04360 [Rhodospirillaceae bacterium]|nr:hypothetical protein [Rhodospirillaceae bacterium]
MIPSLREIVYGVFGAWRLARLDRSAMVHFDRTVEGFWKSFFAAAIVAPAYLILVATDLAERDSQARAFSDLKESKGIPKRSGM